LLAVPQEPRERSLAPLLNKEDGEVDWRDSARAIHDRARGFAPWPSAYAWLDASRLKLHRTQVVDEATPHAEPGEILRAQRDAIVVACGHGALALLELQLEGGRRLTAASSWWDSARIEGARLRAKSS